MGAARGTLALLALLGLSRAAGLRAEPDLTRTDAFEASYVTSFYNLDACGDGLSGKLYRQALLEKFNHCPFSAAARAQFRQRSAAERTKASEEVQALIERTGGLPLRLDGMSTTCHAQQAEPGYQAFRAKLEQYSQGRLPVDDVVPQPCDAASITP